MQANCQETFEKKNVQNYTARLVMVLKCLINDFVLSYWLIWSLYSLGKPCEYIKTISTLWINKYKITPLHIQINKINVAASINTQSFCKFLNQNTCKFLSLIMAHIFLTTSLLAICKKKNPKYKIGQFYSLKYFMN